MRKLPSFGETAMLAEALGCCIAASVLLRTTRFSSIAGRLGTHMAESPEHQPGAMGQTVRRISWAVPRAAAMLPWKALCLPQAIAATWMLRRRGIPSTLYLGADPSRNYDAHAWVRVGGVIVTGADRVDRYAVVSTFA